MIDTYDLTDRIQKAESVADGEAILIEALKDIIYNKEPYESEQL